MTPQPIERFTRDLLSLYQSGRHARKTYLRMRQVLGEISALPGVETTADLTTRTMAAYAATRAAGNANTLNGLLDYLRAACSYAVEEGYLDRPPNWRRVRPRPSEPKLNRPCTYPQIAALLAHLRGGASTWRGRRLYTLVALVALTGLRRDEALYCQLEDLDLAAQSLRIVERSRRLKTAASAREVPIPDSLAPILAAWLPSAGPVWLFPGVKRQGPWRGGMPGKRPIDELKAAAAAVGVQRITWHGLRHTFGTNAVRYFDLPVWAIQRIMGHTDSRTTNRYLKLDEPTLLLREARRMSYG